MTKYTTLQYVELFHLLFLDQLGRRMDKRFYALKGGCNLRFFLKSFRYSEYMDLDVQTVPKEKIENIVIGILKSKPFENILQTSGIRIESWSAPKQTDTTQRWKVGLSVNGSDVPLHTKIELSRRGMRGMTVFGAIDSGIIRDYQIAPIMVNHYDADSAYEQKVSAVINRSTTQARDIFDLNLLLNSGVSRIITDGTLKNRIAEAQANIMAVKFCVFRSQVLSFLPLDYQEQYDSHAVWDDMVLKVVEALGEVQK